MHQAKKMHKFALAKKMHKLLGTTGEQPKDDRDRRVFPLPPLAELIALMKEQHRWDDATG